MRESIPKPTPLYELFIFYQCGIFKPTKSTHSHNDDSTSRNIKENFGNVKMILDKPGIDFSLKTFEENCNLFLSK